MTLIELYQSQVADGMNSEKSRTLLEQTHWFTINADFDPKTGEALPQALSAFLAKVARQGKQEMYHDRLWRITDHARPSVERLFRALTVNPRREHALLPVRAVRELDANSFIKLSNRPGRNIREKLAGKPYLQAVRRFQSVNLPENRLFKAFVTRLADLLALRQDCLREQEDDLLPEIQSWLLSDEAREIGLWDNLPPNNTLLSHRDYRRIWDAWRWLESLDDDITRDLSRLEVRAKTMRLWKEYGRMYFDGAHRFAEMPVLFDCEKFEIHPWVSEKSDNCLRLPPHAVQKASRKIGRFLNPIKISDPVCIDLAVLRPLYATRNASSRNLPDTYLWQQWKNRDEAVDIELFNSDAAYLHPETTSIYLTDLILFKGDTGDHLERAARAFVSRLHDRFKSATLIWVVPDFLNDFDRGLETTRRNLNARFPDAEPLPRSVAAVFERVEYTKIRNDDFSVVVVDTIGGQTCVTKLIARFDPELKKRLPETNGFYWDRCPPIIISLSDTVRAERKEYDVISVDSEGRWHDAVPPQRPPFIDQDTLKGDPRIGPFAYCLKLDESPVVGGIRLHALQQRVGDIPLWRDNIPELSIKVMKAGRYQRFSLVSRGTTVKPIRGQSVPIAIRENFTLPAGKHFYQFPLFHGENADELGFSARLESSAFPLKTDTVCQLNLTFEYGADEPYKLIFEPLDRSFPPVRATWKRTEEIIFIDAPAPGYPAPMTWEDLRRTPRLDGTATSDLLERVLSGLNRLDQDLFIRPQKRAVGEIVRHWGVDKMGKHFTRTYCDEYASEVFIHENNFVHGLRYEDFEQGDKVSFELEAHKGKFAGYRVANLDYKEATRCRNLDENATDALIASIYKRLYFPFIQVWSDGHSITDGECPKVFADSAKDKIQYLTGLLSQPEIPKVVNYRFLFLLACLHKDTTDDCVQWITEQVENDDIRDLRAVGFSLGDVSEGWQQHIFSILASKPNTSAISVFAYAIWREQHFIERFAISELMGTLEALSQRLAKLSTGKPNSREIKEQQRCRDWVRATTQSLELLLGLLRTRASTNPEVRMLLQPHQNITKKLAKQVEQVAKIVVESKIQLFSRVQLTIQKPAGDHTPDLLYALRLYLTGDDGANAIHITSISDSNND